MPQLVRSEAEKKRIAAMVDRGPPEFKFDQEKADRMNAGVNPEDLPKEERGIEESINNQDTVDLATLLSGPVGIGAKILRGVVGVGKGTVKGMIKKGVPDEPIGAGGTQVSKPATMTTPSKPPVNPKEFKREGGYDVQEMKVTEVGGGPAAPAPVPAVRNQKPINKSNWDRYEAAQKQRLGSKP